MRSGDVFISLYPSTAPDVSVTVRRIPTDKSVSMTFNGKVAGVGPAKGGMSTGKFAVLPVTDMRASAT
jgi:hypothetical protein